MFLCYFVFNYPVYKQLVHLSTCQLVQKRSYVTLSLITLLTSNLFTRQLVNPSTRTKTFLCYFVFNYPAYKQLVHSLTRQLVNSYKNPLFKQKNIYLYNSATKKCKV